MANDANRPIEISIGVDQQDIYVPAHKGMESLIITLWFDELKDDPAGELHKVDKRIRAACRFGVAACGAQLEIGASAPGDKDYAIRATEIACLKDYCPLNDGPKQPMADIIPFRPPRK